MACLGTQERKVRRAYEEPQNLFVDRAQRFRKSVVDDDTVAAMVEEVRQVESVGC